MLCALLVCLWLSIGNAAENSQAAGLSVGVAAGHNPKSNDKKKDEKKKDEKESDDKAKSDEGKDDKGKGSASAEKDKKEDESKDKSGGEKQADRKKSEAKDTKNKDESAEGDKGAESEKEDQEGEKGAEDTLSDQDLEEMKRVLMEQLQKRKSASQPAASRPAASPEASDKSGPSRPEPAQAGGAKAAPDEEEAGPSGETGKTAAGGVPVGRPPVPRARPEQKPPRAPGAIIRSSRSSPKPAVPSSSKKRDRRSRRDKSKPADRPSRGSDRDARRGQDDAVGGGEPSMIMPLDLPEGKRPWDMPEDFRPFFFSFDRAQVRDVLEDWSRMSGLSLLDLDKARGQVTYESLEYMNYWEAFDLLNELLADQNLQLVQDEERHHLRLISPSELREVIRAGNTYTSRDRFEQARPRDYTPVKVFFVPPANVSPSQVAQWINDLPESVRLGSVAEGYMHVSGNAKDVRKLFRLVDIVHVQAGAPVEPRPMRWIPVENIDVNQAADLVRQFVETRGTVPKPRGKRAGPPTEALEDYAEVDVIAVPKSRMLLVRAKPATLDRIEALVREVDGRWEPTETEPVIIPLEHANVEEVIPLLESILTGQAVSGSGKHRPKTSVGRKRGGLTGPGQLDLSQAREEIQLLAEPGTNSLIVIADAAGVERVRKLLKVFDVPGSAPIFARVVLEHAKPDVVQQVLNALFGGGKRKKGSSTAEELSIVPDAASKSLFLSGKEDVVRRAREVIAQMDVETEVTVTHLIRLVNQVPTALAQILNQMETGVRKRGKGVSGGEGVKIIGHDATGTLIVSCPDGRWPELKGLIERLDRDVVGFETARTFKIEGSDAQQVANLLKEMFGGRGAKRKGKSAAVEGVSISVDPVGNLIFVRGKEKVVAEMAAVIAEMEAEVAARRTVRRTFQLVHTTAADMVKVLTTFYPATSPVSKGRQISPLAATFAPVGRSFVVVEATAEKMEEITALIGELDTEEQERMEVRSFVVKGADPQQVVKALGSMFRGRSTGKRRAAATGGPMFTAVGKKIIVVADPALFPRIEEAIVQFEGEGTALEFRRYVVQYAEVEEMGGLLEELLSVRAAELAGGASPAPGGKGRRAGGGVVVSADPRTKTLFVAAPGEVMAYADQLINDLDSPGDLEGIVVRTVQLERADVEEMLQAVRQMISSRGEGPLARSAIKGKARTKTRAGSRGLQVQLFGEMKGAVSMVPAPGADAIVLRGIESDVDQVAKLIQAIDAAALSQKKVARRYDALPTGMDTEELADTVMAVLDSSKSPRKAAGAEAEEYALGPRVGKELVITTDWYTDTLLVIATPEKQAEIELLMEALSYETEGPEGVPSAWPLQMVEITYADPYDVRDAVEEVLGEMVERGPKTRVKVIAGSNLLSLAGPPDVVQVLLEVIAKFDDPARKVPDAIDIFHVASPVTLEQMLQLVQQQLPGVELEIEGAGPVLPGYGAEEAVGPEEIHPTLGPNTLAHISAALQGLTGTASDGEEKGDQGTAAGADREAPEGDPDSNLAESEEEKPETPPPAPKVKIIFDPKTGTIRLTGRPRRVKEVRDAIEEVLEELKALPVKPDVRVFRIKYANVTEVAQIMETILGAQSGGAASRAQQRLAQQLQLQKMQQQLLRQRQAQQQQNLMRRMQQQLGQKEEKEPEQEEEEPEERKEEAREFGTTRIRIYPDPRTSTIVVRAATEDYPTIKELIAKIDKPPPKLTDFRIFKLVKLKAADVEAAIKAILRLDRPTARVARPRPGQRPGQQQAGGQMQMITQLQQQMAQLEQAGTEGGVSINWAEQVNITSEASTNTILASGPTEAIDYIERMIEQLEGQEIEKETVRTIQLVHTTVEEVLPALNEIFASKGGRGGAGGRLKMPAGAGQQEVVQAAFSEVVISGDARTNTLIVKAAERDIAEVEDLIAKLDVDTDDEGRMQSQCLAYADAASVAKAMNDIYVAGDKKAGRVRIVADTSTNCVLLSAPSALREEILAQIQAMDVRKGLGSRPRTIAITLGNAETIAEKLQRVFAKPGKGGGEVSILGDNVSKQLVVVAPDPVFERIKVLVASMDRPTSEAYIQIYELQHADAEQTLAGMQDIVKQMAMNKALHGAGKDVDLDAFAAIDDPRTNSLVVMASKGTHAMVAGVLAQMDVPPKDSARVVTRTIPLVLADAGEVARQIQQLYAQRGQAGVEPPVATPNPGTNTVAVRGTQAQLDEIQALIDDLERIQPAGQGELRGYTLRLVYAKADQVAATLNEYFSKKFEAMQRGQVKGVKPTDLQVSITPDINSNQIFVVATEPNKAQIDELLSTMDVEGAGAQTILQTRIFPLTFADPGQTANAINNAFLQRGRFAERERVQAVAEYGTRSLIISANAENMAKVQELITQLDADTGTGRQNFTYQVNEARVVDLVNVLRDFVNQSKSRTGRGQLPIALVANEATNTMLISATKKEYDELLSTIKLLDRPPEAETGRFAKAYKLKYSDPGSVHNIIQNAFQVRGKRKPEDLVASAVDWGTSTLIVVANQENHEKVATLLSEMDQADVSGMEVRQIQVQYVGAQELTQALQQTFIQGQRQRRGESSMSIVNPPGTRVILVRSDERTFREIQRVVADLDLPEGLGGEDVRVVMLENVDAQEAKTILEDYLRKPGGRGKELVGNVRVTPTESLNAVVISGPSAQIDQAVAVVRSFDLDPTERGEAPQVIQLVHADAVQIAETLARMFQPKGGRGRGRAAAEAPVIEAVAGSNSLIVKARKPDLNMIRAVVTSLDTEEMAEGASRVEIIQVAQGIRVEELAREITRVINEAERQRVKGQKGAKASEISIGTDTRTNTMLVSGTRSQVEHVRELVATLEEMKPVGPSKILIRRPLHRSAAEIKEVLDELVEEKSGSGRARSGRSGPRRPPPRRK